MIEKEKIPEASLEELLESYLEVKHAQEQLEVSLSVLKIEMQQRLDVKNLKSQDVRGCRITKTVKIDFKPTLAQAQALNATKVVEELDKEVLKRLHNQGIEIPNTITTEYITVRELKQKESNP